MTLVSSVKSRIVPSEVKVRRVAFGPFRGNRQEIDLRSQSQFVLGLWERETYPSVRRAFSRCEWVVDAGSQGGEYVIALLRKAKASQIVAFDPDPEANEWLRRNLAANGLSEDPRLQLIQAPLGAADDSGCRTVDSLELDPRRHGFIKIDVEGAELAVLHGAERTLRSGTVDLLIETHEAQLERDCVAFLQSCGYACRVLPNAWWRAFIPDMRPAAHNRWLWATNARE